MSKLSEYIKKLRANRSQEEIAKQAGITGAALSRIESGEREDFRISTLIGLSKALNVNPMKLILAYEGKNPEELNLSEQDLDSAMAEALIKRIMEWQQEKYK